MASRLYDPTDPSAMCRGLDDQIFALDHFAAKLFKMAGNFQTATGQALAEVRTWAMRAFAQVLLSEIGEGSR